MPIFGQKTSFLSKLHYFMVIKVNRMPFLFRFFTKKSLLSCPYFYQKYVYSLKTQRSHTHISQKNVHSLKNTVLSCAFFSNFSWKTPVVVHTIGQKRQFCQNNTLFWAKKVNRMPFFSYFSQKKKITALMSIICQKTFIL